MGSSFRRRQRGSALLLVLIAAVALIGVAGLALDASHVGYMKARLQSTVDAMALAAAKRLDEVGTTTAACEAARTTLLANAAGFRELTDALPSTISCPGSPWFQIQYSASASPFAPGSTPARYVRVRIAELETDASLARVLGFVDLAVSASAVAGPSAPLERLCSLLPIAVCGNPTPPYFGFEPGRVYLLKGKQDAKDGTTFGDFHLLRPDASQDTQEGLRRNFAGGFWSCLLIGGGPPMPTIRIKPGSNVGPVAQGVNARFGRYVPAGQLDPALYPPDVLTGEPAPLITVDSAGVLRQQTRSIVYGTDVTGRNRSDYLARLAQGGPYDFQPLPAPGTGAFLRREVAVPVADCTPPINQNALPIRGGACFFLLQQMESGSNESRLIGEFLSNCEAAGRPGPNPGGGGPYVIQMFRDLASNDS